MIFSTMFLSCLLFFSCFLKRGRGGRHPWWGFVHGFSSLEKIYRGVHKILILIRELWEECLRNFFGEEIGGEGSGALAPPTRQSKVTRMTWLPSLSFILKENEVDSNRSIDRFEPFDLRTWLRGFFLCRFRIWGRLCRILTTRGQKLGKLTLEVGNFQKPYPQCLLLFNLLIVFFVVFWS